MKNILDNVIQSQKDEELKGAYDNTDKGEGAYGADTRSSSASGTSIKGFKNNKSGTAGYNITQKQQASKVNPAKPL